MADSEPDGCDDLTSPAAKIASLEAELRETKCHLNCIIGKLSEAEGNYERVQCENALLQKQVALLKKELATFRHADNLQAVNSPGGDRTVTQQCGPTKERGKNLLFQMLFALFTNFPDLGSHCIVTSLSANNNFN